MERPVMNKAAGGHARAKSLTAERRRTEEELIGMGMDFGSRQRFGIPQPTPVSATQHHEELT